MNKHKIVELLEDKHDKMLTWLAKNNLQKIGK